MFLRKYGTGTGADVIIPIIKRGVVDFAVTADWTPASGDVKVSKDGGTEANIATLPVINGTVGWKFVFSDAELQCKSLTVRVVDSATKAIEDQFFIVETYGDASAMFQADLSAANLPANVVQISGDSTAADNLEAAADGTGYNLGAGQIVASSVTANVTLAQSFPANFASLGINGSGHVSRVTLVDTTTTNTDMRGTDNALLSSSYVSPPSAGTISSQVAADLAAAHGAGSWATATGFSTHSAADVWAVVTRTITGGELTTAPPTAASIADAVWDESRTGHTTSGTFGFYLDAAISGISGGGGGGATAAQVWEYATRTLTGAVELASSSLAQFVTFDTGETTAAAGSVAKLAQGSSSGGGTATLEKQEEILAAIEGAEVIQVASPNVSGNLVLTQGDDYDGTANPRAQWTVTTDYTSGWTVALTIRDADDAVVYTTSGTVVSATVIAVTIAAPTGLTMTGCPGQWQGKFDVQLTHTATGKKKTIALGVCYINEDQTR
jgi:hypothetical protein